MMDTENIINDLFAKLLSEGKVSFSQDGLNINAKYDNGCLSISTSFESPKKDEAKELRSEFENYVNSLSDDFFIEVAESYSEGRLKELQDKLDSDDYNEVRKAVDNFMSTMHSIATEKVKAVSKDIEDTEKELQELIEIRDSYTHVLNKKF